MARDFSEVGAAGAGNSLDDAPDPGVGSNPTGAPAAPTTVYGTNIQRGLQNLETGGSGSMAQAFDATRSSGDFGGSGYTPGWNDGGSGSANGAPWASQPTSLGRQDTTGITPWGAQFTQNTGGSQMRFGGFYAEGGAIPEEEGDPNQMGQDPQNGLLAMIQKALTSTQEVLAYGRQKHGIGGGGPNEGAIKEAGLRAPTVPGNQSESGIRPPQPMPGPLPPTSNPFGKRADAQPQDDGDGDSDAPGAIDTDEETA